MGQSLRKDDFVATTPVTDRTAKWTSGSRRVGEPASPALRLERTDLRFRYDAQGMIEIALNVTNSGPQPTAAGRGFIEEARFGAFVSWERLTTFAVPPLQPGESSTLTLRAPRRALGGRPPMEPPANDLAAQPAGSRRPGNLPQLLRRLLEPQFPRGTELTRSELRFAGNLNVHIGSIRVERHLSGPVHVVAGALNTAIFDVGDGTDRYRFELAGEGGAWKARLFEAPFPQYRERFIKLSKWHAGRDVRHVGLLVTPPERCQRGALEVHVEQESTGRVAIVEFELCT